MQMCLVLFILVLVAVSTVTPHGESTIQFDNVPNCASHVFVISSRKCPEHCVYLGCASGACSTPDTCVCHGCENMLKPIP
ncbi:hypothetical protein AB6A40_009549 [Gnathostoma spinigerum]|uniref:Uncharacterized protein n=1 Tax=Gnathostoma spinigerum TaxID=75299 RepID=A0ABD6ETI3_9BILA